MTMRWVDLEVILFNITILKNTMLSVTFSGLLLFISMIWILKVDGWFFLLGHEFKLSSTFLSSFASLVLFCRSEKNSNIQSYRTSFWIVNVGILICVVLTFVRTLIMDAVDATVTKIVDKNTTTSTNIIHISLCMIRSHVYFYYCYSSRPHSTSDTFIVFVVAKTCMTGLILSLPS